MAERDEMNRARDGVADTLASIERGALSATPEQRAYLAGAVEALDAVTSEERPEA